MNQSRFFSAARLNSFCCICDISGPIYSISYLYPINAGRITCEVAFNWTWRTTSSYIQHAAQGSLRPSIIAIEGIPKHLDKPRFDEVVKLSKLTVCEFNMFSDPIELACDCLLPFFRINRNGKIAQRLLANRLKRASRPHRFQLVSGGAQLVSQIVPRYQFCIWPNRCDASAYTALLACNVDGTNRCAHRNQDVPLFRNLLGVGTPYSGRGVILSKVCIPLIKRQPVAIGVIAIRRWRLTHYQRGHFF